MMNRKIVGILISCIVLYLRYNVFHATNMSLTDFTSESVTENSVFHIVSRKKGIMGTGTLILYQ